jgi:hypothetical protein
MQKARRHPNKSGLRPLVSVWFQVLFTPLVGVLFTFPLRYSSTIGLSVVFSLTGWCRQIQTEFHQLRPTQDTRQYIFIQSTGLSPSSVALSIAFLLKIYTLRRSYNPIIYNHGLGSSAFARHYSQNHFCFLFLRLLRCFSSPGCLCNCLQRHIFNMTGCPIRTSMDLCSFAAPHSFSQLTTSFVVSESQGIPHTPLFASNSLFILPYRNYK